MIQFGASTFIWVSPFSTADFDLVHKAKAMGYDILEVAVEQQELIDWARLKEITRQAGIKVTISGAFGPDRDISSTDAAIRENGYQYIADCSRIARDMGSPVFTGPVYSAVGKTRLVSEAQKQQERTWCVENLKRVGEVAAQHGVVVGVEPLNRFETDMINTVDQVLALVQEVAHPNIKISLDTFHSNIEEKNIPTCRPMKATGVPPAPATWTGRASWMPYPISTMRARWCWKPSAPPPKSWPERLASGVL